MITFKPILILGILAPFWASVGAENVTDIFHHPTEGLTASPLMSEQEHKIDWELNPKCPLPEVNETRLGLNCTPGTLASNLATTVAAMKIVAPEAPPSALTNETTEQDDKILTNSWVWSMVNGSSPALMVSMVDPKYDDVDVNWFHIVGGELAFKYKIMPEFSSGVMMTKLLEFDDPKNQGVYDGKSEVIEYPTKKLTWKREVIHNTSSIVAMSFLGSLTPSNGSQSSDEAAFTGGFINITLAAYANVGFGKWLPHLSHSHKTNQFDIQLQNITTNSGFNFSRFGIEMVLVASLNSSTEDERRIRHTNDDEHTPGTFEYDELVIVNDDDNDLQSYMQWKPIVYCSEERGKLGTNAHMLHANVTNTTELKGTMLHSFYGDQLNAMLVRKINVTFGKAGKQGDTSGYYSKTRFHAWTFTFGTGVPIEPGWSPKFVIAASVTLLVVVLACAGGAAACCYRKYTRSRSLNISNSNPYSRLGGAGS